MMCSRLHPKESRPSLRHPGHPRLAMLLSLLVIACGSDDDPVAPEPEPLGCPADSAVYTLTFASTWSSSTHPVGFPEFAHYSGLIGATHDETVTVWENDELASPGIQNMAETGSKNPLQSELATEMAAGSVGRIISGGGIARSPGQVQVTFTATNSFPLVSVVSMIAPSPDWFVGVHGLSLCDEGAWADSIVVDLYAYDAGTDSGVDYGSPNEATIPHVPIYPLTETPFKVGNDVPSLGTFTFVRQQ